MCPFWTAQSRGGVFLFGSDTWVTVKNGAECHTTAFLHHTHTRTHTDGSVLVHSCPVSTPFPLPRVSSPVLGHVTLLYIDCGHFGFELHIQCPLVYTTDALRKGDTQLGGEPMKLPSVTVFRPFLTWKKHNLVFKLFCSPPSLSFMEDQTLLSFFKLPVIWH